jgi:actin-like ATPase involved in cell morphogenesis
MPIGFDVGTYNLVSCCRDKNNDFSCKREVNAFIDIPLDNKFLFNIMKGSNVPIIERENVAYILGEAACNMAYTMKTVELKRPMIHGCVNPKEKDAFQIMSIMMHSLINGVNKDGETLYYCIPANAINQDTDADYHQKLLGAIFKAYKNEFGYRVDAHPINEALALVYAELQQKAYTGIGMSFGAGMVNICYAMYGNPIFSFSIVNSGDWIDRQAAKATGESPIFINKEKTKIDLSKQPSSLVERAIYTQYQLMIEHTVSEIKKGFADANKTVRSDSPVDIVVAGGTSSPNGFADLLKQTIESANLPIPIGDIIKPEDPLHSVARGCLLAAESAAMN